MKGIVSEDSIRILQEEKILYNYQETKKLLWHWKRTGLKKL